MTEKILLSKAEMLLSAELAAQLNGAVKRAKAAGLSPDATMGAVVGSLLAVVVGRMGKPAAYDLIQTFWRMQGMPEKS